jgi:DNA-binding transcriptional regulator YhcF (GntR family)
MPKHYTTQELITKAVNKTTEVVSDVTQKAIAKKLDDAISEAKTLGGKLENINLVIEKLANGGLEYD